MAGLPQKVSHVNGYIESSNKSIDPQKWWLEDDPFLLNYEIWGGFHIILSNWKNICVNLSLAAQGFNRSYGKCLGNPITHTLCPAEFPKDSRHPCVSGRGFAQEFPSNDESLGTVGKKVVRPRGRNSRTSRTSRASGSSILTQNHFLRLRVINLGKL